MLRARIWQVSTLLAMLVGAGAVGAQAPTASPPPAPALPPLSFSGQLYGNYSYQLPTTPAPFPGQNDNAFTLERADLNFRIPAGDRVSIRVTTDVYQSTEDTPNGWTIRAKYAYLQYDIPKFANGSTLIARVGLVNNVEIEHEEQFWSRYVSQTPVERYSYFQRSDAGVATLYTLANKMGEVYSTITNGAGYTTRENNRFKDFATRVSLTPLANSTDLPMLHTFTLTGFAYKGASASGFVNGGVGQVGAVGEALDKSRYGLLIGVRDPRLTMGFTYDLRHENGEQGANTTASPRIVTDVTGTVASVYAEVRPLAFSNADGKSPFGVIARYDHAKPTSSTAGYFSPAAPSPDNTYHTIIAGVFWDMSQKSQIALDYQEQLASSNGLSLSPPGQSKGYFAHWRVEF